MNNDRRDVSAQSEQTAQASDGLACNCCRKRKLRCSRELPICEHCRKTGQDCVYETKRGRPGMKAGAIDNVHKRLDALERTITKQQTLLEKLSTEEASSNVDSQETIDGKSLLLSLAREICKLSNTPSPSADRTNDEPIAKRRRTNNNTGSRTSRYTSNQPLLPDDIALDHILDAYFRQIHPWIPMIHEARFRRRLQEHSDETNLLPILQAIVLISYRHISQKDIAESVHNMLGGQDTRDWIVAKATKSLSVENLQALIIICFHDIGDGHESQAWPLIGALTRMVEYLQITVECEEADRSSFSQPFTSLPPPQGWAEAEERRRVFWCVFKLDRFCSVTTAWNTSLTSDDVNRRLPCDGITWRKEDPVSTPYFGIWDKSAGRIGNPITFLPSLSAAAPTDDDGTPSEATTSPGAVTNVDMSTVGAFAYCIEATESMSRVTSYFLQQKVNIKDHKDLSSWITRFKELDVRLVHWKMLLPRKWKVNLAQQSSSRMDPNLTLAHLTHNASMILLHQPIGFPPLDWTFKTRLPSFCSLDTCQAAAIEIATITDHYLRIAATGPLSNQFAFCVYLAARVLLLHWRYCATDALSAEFWLLMQSLELMAKWWTGPHQLGPGENFASKYQSTLTDLHDRCIQDESFAINPSAYTTEVKPKTDQHGRGQNDVSSSGSSQPQAPDVNMRQNSETQYVQPNTPGNPYFNGIATNMVGSQIARSRSVGSGDLGVISQMLLDAEFVDMDRVISFDDGIFGTEHEGGCF
ncbi:fungal-specific transcription factor domain-containing protein [Fusarium avenaceum]|nr:fungal-specific transcription factor domain-containing protein [Fusarium avenaceum]